MFQKSSSPCKPYIPHHISIERPNPLSNKRLYKYVHHLKFRWERILNDPKTLRIKTLKSLDMDRGLPPYFRFQMKHSIITKFIKPRQKYLKTLKGELQRQPRPFKLLPLLLKIRLNPDPLIWRLFRTRSKFQTIFLDLQHQRKLPKDPKRLLSSQKLSSYPLPRAISHQHNLQNLNITLNRGPQAKLLLNLLNKVDFSTIDLKDFQMNLLSAYKWPYQANLQVTPEAKKALGYVMKLTLHDTRWFGLIFDGFVLKNLSVLDIKISPKEMKEFGMLSTLREMKKLKELSLIFRAGSVEIEDQFLENFRLPSNLEKVCLVLVNFQWNDTELTKANLKTIQEKFDHRFFFHQWKNLKQLKTLDFTIKEESNTSKRCPGLAGNFASRILRQTNSLEKIKFTHYLGQLKPSEKKKIALPVKSLDFEEFWRALEGSKNTLQSLTIDVPEIAFPVKMSSVENKFPRLKRISLGKRILWGKDLGCFWSLFKNKKRIEIQELIFKDEKRFEDFLNGIRKIPKEVNLLCKVNVENLQYETLMPCLKVYVEEACVMGEFQLYLTKFKGEENISVEKKETCLVNFEVVRIDKETLLLKMKENLSR